MYVYNYSLLGGFVRLNYIANNLQNSHVVICFCALRNAPVNLLKVPFKRCTSIYMYNILYIYCILYKFCMCILYV